MHSRVFYLWLTWTRACTRGQARGNDAACEAACERARQEHVDVLHAVRQVDPHGHARAPFVVCGCAAQAPQLTSGERAQIDTHADATSSTPCSVSRATRTCAFGELMRHGSKCTVTRSSSFRWIHAHGSSVPCSAGASSYSLRSCFDSSLVGTSKSILCVIDVRGTKKERSIVSSSKKWQTMCVLCARGLRPSQSCCCAACFPKTTCWREGLSRKKCALARSGSGPICVPVPTAELVRRRRRADTPRPRVLARPRLRLMWRACVRAAF